MCTGKPWHLLTQTCRAFNVFLLAGVPAAFVAIDAVQLLSNLLRHTTGNVRGCAAIALGYLSYNHVARRQMLNRSVVCCNSRTLIFIDDIEAIMSLCTSTKIVIRIAIKSIIVSTFLLGANWPEPEPEVVWRIDKLSTRRLRGGLSSGRPVAIGASCKRRFGRPIRPSLLWSLLLLLLLPSCRKDPHLMNVLTHYTANRRLAPDFLEGWKHYQQIGLPPVA